MRYIIIISIIFWCVGCSVVSRLERTQSRAIVEYVPPKQKVQETRTPQSYIEVKRDSTTFFLAPAITDQNGEQIMCVNLGEVVVVAKSRTLTERQGRVMIDFVVTLPTELQGNCQSVSVVPLLHKTDSIVPLQELSIRGGLFSRVQDRNYWQFNQYVRIFRPDSTAEQRAFERFIKHPYPEGVRLDSIVEGSEKIAYYYTQEVSMHGEGKKMLITLNGRVVALDGSSYELPTLDTLQYNISSMLTFTDTTTRYVTKIVEKYAVVNDKNYLSFKVGDTRIIDTLGDNGAQLSHIEGLMDELINQREFYVDSVILTASASPEGAFSLNNLLARQRALSLKKRLADRFGRGTDTLITVRWIGEHWQELSRLIARDEHIAQKEAILEVIGSVSDPDKRETLLRGKYPKQYEYIRATLYPLLRSVSFKYDLRRVGMVKDTVHTTVPDTLYARGVSLLGERRYREALCILEDYRDQNSAVALLSLGDDQMAYDILSRLPQTAEVCYLSAIACSRLGKAERGRECFIRACNLKETFEYRGKLDPEINNLLIDDE